MNCYYAIVLTGRITDIARPSVRPSVLYAQKRQNWRERSRVPE